MIHNHYPTIEDLKTGEIEIERELESLRNERIWRKIRRSVRDAKKGR